MSNLIEVKRLYEQLQDAKSHLRKIKADPNTSQSHIALATESVKNCRRWLTGSQFAHAEKRRQETLKNNYSDRPQGGVGQCAVRERGKTNSPHYLPDGFRDGELQAVERGSGEVWNVPRGVDDRPVKRRFGLFGNRRPFQESITGDRPERITRQEGRCSTTYCVLLFTLAIALLWAIKGGMA